MKKLALLTALLTLTLALPTAVFAQNTDTPKQNTLDFSVVVEKEVPMDILQVRLFIQEEDANLQNLHKTVSDKLNQALTKIKAQAKVVIQQNNRNTSVRYDAKGRKNGWTERAELLLESQDFYALSQLIDDVSDVLSISSVNAKLSFSAQDKLDDELTQAVLAKFRQKADLMTKSLQAKSYRIVSLSLPNTQQRQSANGYDGDFTMYRAAKLSATEEPVQLESGTTHLKKQLNATIELIQE